MITFLLCVILFLVVFLMWALYIDYAMRPERVALVEAMRDGEWHYGLDLVRGSNGKISRGSIYILLSRLERDGLVVSEYAGEYKHTPGVQRRRYRMLPVPPVEAMH